MYFGQYEERMEIEQLLHQFDMEVRVRLVFADDVGRYVQRRRGFSSCWYLVPKDAKLVGDLAHALLLEFGLRKRCPKGLELRLDDLPVLATQSIRIVRDNDTIVVQCPPLDDVGSETSSSESEVKTQRRKRKLRRKEQPKKKAKLVKLVKEVKEVKNGQRCNGNSSGKKAVKSVAGGNKSSKVERSDDSLESSDSSSESSSESSSSSTSDSEDEPAVQQQRKNTHVITTNVQESRKRNGVANGVANQAKGLEQNGKEPRRRRRRLRQRSGGRQRNGNQANKAGNSANQTSLSGNDSVPLGQEQMRTAPVRTKQTSLSTRQHVGSIAVGPRGFPRAKAHVVFDEVTGDQVAVQHDEHVLDSRENGRRFQDPELAKYGPSSSGNQRSGSHQDQTAFSSNLTTGRNEEINDGNSAPKRKGKDKYEERWKRPYEIVATVHDKKSEESSSSTPDLTKLLDSYPTAPTTSLCFKPNDIIAFKTLTLCLETWQPVVSEWKCGQVRSVDGSGIAIELSSWTLETNGDSVNFHEAPNSEQIGVQTSEISEVRFLSGPSYTSLGQTPFKANRDIAQGN